jgi:hypothetical protein
LRAKLVSKISKYLPCKGLSSHSDKDWWERIHQALTNCFRTKDA